MILTKFIVLTNKIRTDESDIPLKLIDNGYGDPGEHSYFDTYDSLRRKFTEFKIVDKTANSSLTICSWNGRDDLVVDVY